MKYLFGYFVIGLVISAVLTEFSKSDWGEEKIEVSTMNQFWFAVLWPVMIILIVKEFLKIHQSNI